MTISDVATLAVIVPIEAFALLREEALYVAYDLGADADPQ
jgi:hypothetical protein